MAITIGLVHPTAAELEQYFRTERRILSRLLEKQWRLVVLHKIAKTTPILNACFVCCKSFDINRKRFIPHRV
jgi:hypothetical protein